MSVEAVTRYRRADRVLWRDTGRHVVVVPAGCGAEVLVLGGGGAALWRHLEQPADASGLRARFAEAGPAPGLAELAEHLERLAALHLLETEEPRP